MRFMGLKSRCWQGRFLSGISREKNQFFGLLQLVKTSSILWVMVSFHQSVLLPLHHFHCLWPSCFPLIRTLTKYGPILIVQSNLPSFNILNLTTSARTILVCNRTYSQVLGIRAWASWGGAGVGIIQPTILSYILSLHILHSCQQPMLIDQLDEDGDIIHSHIIDWFSWD